jgi:hypothetical protein
MDMALLVYDLVPLLEAYEAACQGPGSDKRADLADAILQGMSADPELFLARLDLLAALTMIEDLFIVGARDGQARHTPMGDAHLERLGRYGALVGRLAERLSEDAAALDPAGRVYSPQGVAYGFCADLLSNMALDRLLSQASFGLSLEDMFASRGSLDDKRARAKAWEALPTRHGERAHFAHSAEWAAQMHARLMTALRARSTSTTVANATDVTTGRLFVVPESVSVESLPDGLLPRGIVPAQEHCVTSDLTRALSSGATAFPRTQIVSDRNEARFLASAECDGTWFGISKVVLTVCASHGNDALLVDVPSPVIDVLRLTCPGLVRLG